MGWSIGHEEVDYPPAAGRFQGTRKHLRLCIVNSSLKNRILASCEEHKLEYITDPTNFQPELTLRNAIRQLISKNSFDPQVCTSSRLLTLNLKIFNQSLGENVPPYIAQSLDQVQHSIASLESVDMDPSGGLEHLRSVVTVLSEQVEDMDSLGS